MRYGGYGFKLGLLLIIGVFPWVIHVFDGTIFEGSLIAKLAFVWLCFGALMYVIHPFVIKNRPRFFKNLTFFAVLGLLPILPFLLPIINDSYIRSCLRRYSSFDQHAMSKLRNLTFYIENQSRGGLFFFVLILALIFCAIYPFIEFYMALSADYHDLAVVFLFTAISLILYCMRFCLCNHVLQFACDEQFAYVKPDDCWYFYQIPLRYLQEHWISFSASGVTTFKDTIRLRFVVKQLSFVLCLDNLDANAQQDFILFLESHSQSLKK